jgi:hypothetical protein
MGHGGSVVSGDNMGGPSIASVDDMSGEGIGLGV